MKSEGRKAKYCLIAVGAVLLRFLAQPALAVTVTNWKVNPQNTLWNNPNNWDNGVPAANYIAFLRSTTGSKTATLNVTTPQLSAVVVDAFTVPGTFTLNQSYYPLGNLNAAAETIGDLGTAVYNQSAGSNTVGGVPAGLPPDTIAQTRPWVFLHRQRHL